MSLSNTHSTKSLAVTNHSAANLVAIATALSVLVSAPANAEIVYELQALEGQIAGSHISGLIILPDSAAGLSIWDISMATSLTITSDFGPGYTWTENDIMNSKDVAFIGAIGDLVLTPIHLGGEPGYAPDWRFDTIPHNMPSSISLGLGADNGSPIWNLVELGAPGNLDFNSTPLPGGPPQWQLFLVPAPASSTLLLASGIMIACRRRR